MARIPDRLRRLLESVEPEAEVTVEGSDDGWTVSVELDHLEYLDDEHEEGRRLHVVVIGDSGNPNDAADEAARRLEQIIGPADDEFGGWPQPTPPRMAADGDEE
ncbi:MAG: hypothetical protein M3295_01990 [Chloroflexota bacterium]|nr:hypothetical protein [Chloroflexota bacterium]